MILRGKIWKYADDVNTDVIMPARYLSLTEPAEMAKHCMEDLDAEFSSGVQKGDIIVAGANFGCGSSREHAPIAMKAAGVSCVIAKSFARIFFRNAINIALPVLECPEAVEGAAKGDVIEVDTASGEIKNTTKGKTYKAVAFPEFVQGIISAGGLMNYAKQRMGGKK